MNDTRTSTAACLRERAAYYRASARDAASAGIARELHIMADEYEQDARRIPSSAGAKAPRHPPRPPDGDPS